MSKYERAGLAVVLSVLASGCATLTGSKTETIAVNSEPQGAEIRVDGVPHGKTPAMVAVARKRPPSIQLVMDGHETQECRLHTSAGTGYIVADSALCLFLFPVGCVSFIDAGGAWNKFESPSCNVTLRPVVAKHVEQAPAAPPSAAAPAAPAAQVRPAVQDAPPHKPSPQKSPPQPAPQVSIPRTPW